MWLENENEIKISIPGVVVLNALWFHFYRAQQVLNQSHISSPYWADSAYFPPLVKLYSSTPGNAGTPLLTPPHRKCCSENRKNPALHKILPFFYSSNIIIIAKALPLTPNHKNQSGETCLSNVHLHTNLLIISIDLTVIFKAALAQNFI